LNARRGRDARLRRTGLRISQTITALCLLAPAVLAIPKGGEPAADLRADAERVTRQVELLRQRVELATGDAFYLLLDPAAGDLRLMLKGAILQDYPILGLEVGQPRVGFIGRGLPAAWEGRIWSKGSLDPTRAIDRVEVEIPPPGQEEPTKPPVIPPTPEEKYPVPSRYRIRYEGGLSLEVRPRQMDEKATAWERTKAAWAVWWNDARAVLDGSPEDTLRLRLVLRPEDADSLYRALPPDTRLLIVPPS